MSTVLELATLCQKIYDPIDKSQWDCIYQADGVTLGVRKGANGLVTLTFPGSEKLLDWLRDGRPVPIVDQRLGVHVFQGVMQGLCHVFDMALPMLKAAKRVEIAGHSLGAMHAVAAAALCAKAGVRVAMLLALEPAKVGMEGLAKLVQGNCDRILVTRSGCDPVPTLPLTLPGLEWQHPAKLLELNAGEPLWDGIADHMIAKVIAGLQAAKVA